MAFSSPANELEQKAKEIDSEPNKQHDEHNEKHDGGGKKPRLAFHLAHHVLIIIYKALNQTHVAHVGMIENIKDIAHEERQKALHRV